MVVSQNFAVVHRRAAVHSFVAVAARNDDRSEPRIT